MFNIIVCKNYDEVSEQAFKLMKDIMRKEKPVLGLATGSSPVGLYKLMILGNELGLSCHFLKRILGNDLIYHCNGIAELVLADKLSRMNAELCSKHSVVSARAAASEHMTGYADSCFSACHLLYL